MKRYLASALLALAAPAAHAQDFDWQRDSDRKTIVEVMRNWANFCHRELSYPVRDMSNLDIISGKLKAHWLLKSTAAIDMPNWVEMFQPMLKESDFKERLIDRAADAILAAVADPSSYAEAEKLYVDTIMTGYEAIKLKCDEGVRHPFLEANFYYGEGAIEDIRPRMREAFAASVKEQREEAAKPKPAPRRPVKKKGA